MQPQSQSTLVHGARTEQPELADSPVRFIFGDVSISEFVVGADCCDAKYLRTPPAETRLGYFWRKATALCGVSDVLRLLIPGHGARRRG